jgi:hypothetical protein
LFTALIPAQNDKVVALKRSVAENQRRLRSYKWIETTVVRMKGEEKSATQKLCYYGPDGKVVKQPLNAPSQQQAPGGLKGKVVAQKKEEITEYMQSAVALVHQYVPPDPQRIQAAVSAGKLSVNPIGPGAMKISFPDYLKAGDAFSLSLDTASNSVQTVNVKSYLQSQQDAVALDVVFNRLPDGLSYPGNSTLSAPAKQLQVVVQNSNYQPVSQSSVTPTPAASPAIDQLTAPIALYPDALIAQILTAATNPASLQTFAQWLAATSSLKGSELQEAAQRAGFDPALIALAPFPQVIQMMVQKPEWTRQLGQAFAADKNAVFNSIQRLRVQAQAAGNLTSTAQQQVQTQTTASGQQIIVVQPANPQVVYVPQYNPQTVYTSPPPSSGPSPAAAAAIGFTAGVVIGHASTPYYYGPYAWHGAALYNEAWEAREDYIEHRQDYLEDRQDMYQKNAEQRQSTSQANQAQRQSSVNENQAQRQTNLDSRQTQAQSNQAQRQTSVDTRQSEAQANMGARQSQIQTSATTAKASWEGQVSQRQAAAAATSSLGSGQLGTQRSGMGSGSFSGYQNGAATRAQSSRGNGSLSASRGGGRR